MDVGVVPDPAEAEDASKRVRGVAGGTGNAGGVGALSEVSSACGVSRGAGTCIAATASLLASLVVVFVVVGMAVAGNTTPGSDAVRRNRDSPNLDDAAETAPERRVKPPAGDAMADAATSVIVAKTGCTRHTSSSHVTSLLTHAATASLHVVFPPDGVVAARREGVDGVLRGGGAVVARLGCSVAVAVAVVVAATAAAAARCPAEAGCIARAEELGACGVVAGACAASPGCVPGGDVASAVLPDRESHRVVRSGRWVDRGAIP